MDDDEARWRILEAVSAIGSIKQSIEHLDTIVNTVAANQFDDEPQNAWKVLRMVLGTFRITIRKSPERITDLDELSGAEIAWRYNFWECSDPLCTKRHCRECGKHGKYGGGHLCKCQECLTDYDGLVCPKCGREGGTPKA